MRWLVGLALLGGCGPCIVECAITGRVALGVDLDPNSFFETLELQGYVKPNNDRPPPIHPAFHVSMPIRYVTFPYDYYLPQWRDSNDGTVFVRAWLSHDPTTSAVRVGEPYGKTVAEVDGCTADNVDFTIDQIAGEQE